MAELIHGLGGELDGDGRARSTDRWKADLYDYARREYGTREAANWWLDEARLEPIAKAVTFLARIRKLLHAEPATPGPKPSAVPENRNRYAGRLP